MVRVSGQEDTAFAMAFRDQHVLHPLARMENFGLDVQARETAYLFSQISGGWRDGMISKMLAIVLNDQRSGCAAPGA